MKRPISFLTAFFLLGSPALAVPKEDVFQYFQERVSNELTIKHGKRLSDNEDCRLEIRFQPERVISETLRIPAKLRLTLSVNEPGLIRKASYTLDDNIPNAFQFDWAEIDDGILNTVVRFIHPEDSSKNGRDALTFADDGRAWTIQALQQKKAPQGYETYVDMTCQF